MKNQAQEALGLDSFLLQTEHIDEKVLIKVFLISFSIILEVVIPKNDLNFLSSIFENGRMVNLKFLQNHSLVGSILNSLYSVKFSLVHFK